MHNFFLMVRTPPHYFLVLKSANHVLAGYIPVDLFRPSLTHLDIPNSQFSHVFFEQACLITNAIPCVVWIEHSLHTAGILRS